MVISGISHVCALSRFNTGLQSVPVHCNGCYIWTGGGAGGKLPIALTLYCTTWFYWKPILSLYNIAYVRDRLVCSKIIWRNNSLNVTKQASAANLLLKYRHLISPFVRPQGISWATIVLFCWSQSIYINQLIGNTCMSTYEGLLPVQQHTAFCLFTIIFMAWKQLVNIIYGTWGFICYRMPPSARKKASIWRTFTCSTMTFCTFHSISSSLGSYIAIKICISQHTYSTPSEASTAGSCQGKLLWIFFTLFKRFKMHW